MRLMELEAMVTEAYNGKEVTVLDSTERKALLRIEDGSEKIDYCITSIDEVNKAVYNGKYFTAFSEQERAGARNRAWKAWRAIAW